MNRPRRNGTVELKIELSRNLDWYERPLNTRSFDTKFKLTLPGLAGATYIKLS